MVIHRSGILDSIRQPLRLQVIFYIDTPRGGNTVVLRPQARFLGESLFGVSIICPHAQNNQ